MTARYQDHCQGHSWDTDSRLIADTGPGSPVPGVTASSVAWWLLILPTLFSQLPPGSLKSPSVAVGAKSIKFVLGNRAGF